MPSNSPVRSLQSYIEEPEIRILALSSSSIQDQAALITDRKTCLSTLSSHLTSSTGVPVHNCLVFFYGDKLAVQFERGSKVVVTIHVQPVGVRLHALMIFLTAST